MTRNDEAIDYFCTTGWDSKNYCGCDCDFHKGNWATYSLKIRSWSGAPLRYGKPGDVLPPGFCNHPTYPHSEPKDMARYSLNSCFKVRVTQPIVNAHTGFNCRTCNQRNDYAIANQRDGTYVCFNCR